jgi:hypothetical protein
MKTSMKTNGLRSLALACVLLGSAACGVPARIESINPKVPERATRTAIDETLDTLETPANQRRIALLTAQYSGAIVDAILEAVAQGTHAAVQELVRSLDEELEPALRRVVASQASAAGRGVVEGATAALAEADEERQGAEGSGIVSKLSRFARAGADLATILAITFGLAIVFLVAWIAKLLSEAKRTKERAKLRKRRSFTPRREAHA